MSNWKGDYFRTFQDSEIIIEIKSSDKSQMNRRGTECSDVSKDYCENAVQNDKEKRCSLMLRGLQYGMIRKVSEFCPVACNTCPEQTLSPMMQPSNSPSGISSILISKDTEEVFEVISDTKLDNFIQFQIYKENSDLGISHRSTPNLKESSQDIYFNSIPTNLVYIFTFLAAFLSVAAAYHKYRRNHSLTTISSQKNSNFELFGESSHIESKKYTGENTLVTLNPDEGTNAIVLKRNQSKDKKKEHERCNISEGHTTTLRTSPFDIEHGALVDDCSTSTAVRVDCPTVIGRIYCGSLKMPQQKK